MYEITGKVKRIGALKKFSSGFSKRELVIDAGDRDGKENPVSLQFKRDNAKLVDNLGFGAKVKIAFAIDGREWPDPKTNEVKCFCDLTALKLEVLEQGAAVPQKPAKEKGSGSQPSIDDAEDGDVPF